MELKFYCRLHKSTSLDALGDTHTQTHVYIYIFICVCVCVYIYIYIYIYIYQVIGLIGGEVDICDNSAVFLADLLRHFGTVENYNQEWFFVEIVHHRK
jgi:hypothetical protein